MEQQYVQPEETQPSTAPLSTLPHRQILPGMETSDTAVQAEPSISVTPPVLTPLLRQEARLRRKQRAGFYATVAGFVLAMLWIINRISTNPDSFVTYLRFLLLALLGTGVYACAHCVNRSYRRKRALTTALAHVRDVQQVGDLVQALKVENTLARNLAKHALIDLLPAMKASDAALLDTAERDILLRYLSISPRDPGYRDVTELFSRSAYRREIDLRIAILKALEQVGGAKELPVVTRLSRGLPTLNSASRVPKEVTEAAMECLPYLQERATEQLAREQLLRASAADATSGDVLLRSATAQKHSATEELLLASETRKDLIASPRQVMQATRLPT